MFGLPSLPAIEATLMMRPDLRAFMPRNHRLAAQEDAGDVDLHHAVASPRPTASSSGAARPAMPALFTRMSIGPTSVSAVFTAASTDARLVTSHCAGA